MEKYNLSWLKGVKTQFQEGNNALAMENIEEYMEKYPNDQYIKSIFGQFLFQAGEKEKAKEILEPLNKNIYSAKKQVKQINSR